MSDLEDNDVHVEWADMAVGIDCPCGDPDGVVLSTDRLDEAKCPGCGAVYNSYPISSVEISRDGAYQGAFG